MKPIPTITTAKKVLINPHFKGHINIIESNSIEDAAERFIAEQRLVLARNHHRNISIRVDRRSDEYPPGTEDSAERELLRKQEEFINANRAGLRRRMRSPSPLSLSPPPERRKRLPLPRRSPPLRERERERDRERERERRIPRDDDDKDLDQETIDYRRRIRHRDELRAHVLHAKEERRRANAYQRHLEAERESKEKAAAAAAATAARMDNETVTRADTATTITAPAPAGAVPGAPQRLRPAPALLKSALLRLRAAGAGPARAAPLAPPAPPPPPPEDEEALELEMAMEELAEVLCADEDQLMANLNKDKEKAADAAKAKLALKAVMESDLRSKLPRKAAAPEPERPGRPRQKIVFGPPGGPGRTPPGGPGRTPPGGPGRTPPGGPGRTPAGGPGRTPAAADAGPSQAGKGMPPPAVPIYTKNFGASNEDNNVTSLTTKSLPNRRVVLQRAADAKVKPMSIFSKALSNIKIDKGGSHEPTIIIEGRLERPTIEDLPDDGSIHKVIVDNLPPGMTELRLKTLAGNNCTKADIRRELSRAELTFTGLASAEHFFKRFNNRTVAACMLKLTMV